MLKSRKPSIAKKTKAKMCFVLSMNVFLFVYGHLWIAFGCHPFAPFASNRNYKKIIIENV